jgi:hypothetical protein
MLVNKKHNYLADGLKPCVEECSVLTSSMLGKGSIGGLWGKSVAGVTASESMALQGSASTVLSIVGGQTHDAARQSAPVDSPPSQARLAGAAQTDMREVSQDCKKALNINLTCSMACQRRRCGSHSARTSQRDHVPELHPFWDTEHRSRQMCHLLHSAPKTGIFLRSSPAEVVLQRSCKSRRWITC